MKKKTIYIDELYHHGVKGMKWGIRKQHQSLGYVDGSKRTQRKLNKALAYDKKAGPNQTAAQRKKFLRMVNAYEKSASRDVKKAISRGDMTSARSVASGKAYMKMLTDSRYASKAMSDAAASANVPAGKNFTYNVTRNMTKGSVDITVNGTTSSYFYTDPKTGYKLVNG